MRTVSAVTKGSIAGIIAGSLLIGVGILLAYTVKDWYYEDQPYGGAVTMAIMLFGILILGLSVVYIWDRMKPVTMG